MYYSHMYYMMQSGQTDSNVLTWNDIDSEVIIIENMAVNRTK